MKIPKPLDGSKSVIHDPPKADPEPKKKPAPKPEAKAAKKPEEGK